MRLVCSVLVALVALAGCGSVEAISDAPPGSADAPPGSPDGPPPQPFDVAYVSEWPVTGLDIWAPAMALIINRGTTPLDLTAFAFDNVTDDHPTIVFDFAAYNLDIQVPAGQAAGTLSGSLVEGLLLPLVPETRADTTVPLFGFFLSNYTHPTTATVHASVRLHNATEQVTLDFTLNVETGGSGTTFNAVRVSSVPL